MNIDRLTPDKIAARLLMTAVIAMFFLSHAICAEETGSVIKQKIAKKGFLTLKTENYTVPIDAASGWTIEKMEYRGETFSLNNGHYGTVLKPKGGQWWGTGHTEGGREVVHHLELMVDGRNVPVKIGETVTGKRIELIKKSTIWKFNVHAEVTLNNEYVIERTVLEAQEDCQTDLIYYFMHCFPPVTTKWLARLPDGSIEQGPLTAARGMRLNKESTWVAQFDPQKQIGILCYTPRVITGDGSRSMIWDLDRYHKYYLRQNDGQNFKKGDRLDFSVIVKVVPGETGDWKKTRDAAEKLLKNYPEAE